GLIGAGHIANCVVVGNHGLISTRTRTPTASEGLFGCTIVYNTSTITARVGRGSILRGNIGAWNLFTSMSHNNVDRAVSGSGNIDADPLFVRDPSPGADGVWGTVDDDYGDLRLRPGSPCIDAGDSTAFGDEVE